MKLTSKLGLQKVKTFQSRGLFRERQLLRSTLDVLVECVI